MRLGKLIYSSLFVIRCYRTSLLIRDPSTSPGAIPEMLGDSGNTWNQQSNYGNLAI